MRAVITTAIVASACHFERVPLANPPDAKPWLTGFAYRRHATITSGVGITLDDFVVAVILPADASLAAHARPDGRDLAITSDDESTVLDFELERFDGLSGALAMWVRIPTLAAQTTVYLYYGDADAADLDNPAGTWTASTFRGVWHLTDAAPEVAQDSAGTHPLASPTGSEPATQSLALVAGGRLYDGVNDTLNVADDGALSFGTSSFSYGVWVNVAQSAGSFDMPMFKGGSSAGVNGYDLELGTGGWSAYVGDGMTNTGVSFGSETTWLGSWVQLVAVVDRSPTVNQLIGYANGVESSAVSLATLGSLSSTRALELSTASYPFRGQLDEARIYARALSPEWVAAEYANLSSPSTFVQIDAEEAR